MTGTVVQPRKAGPLVVEGITDGVPLLVTEVQAYICPGAGFEVLGSLLVVLTRMRLG